MINTQYSRQIYRLLINGKTINRQIYDKLSGNLQDNGLFDEIAKHYNDTDGNRITPICATVMHPQTNCPILP